MSMNRLAHDMAHLPHRQPKNKPGNANKPDEPNKHDAKARTPKPGSQPIATDDLKSLPVAEVQKRLGSSPEGLSQAEAAKRLVQYGPNEIEEAKTDPLLKLLTYFWGRSRG